MRIRKMLEKAQQYQRSDNQEEAEKIFDELVALVSEVYLVVIWFEQIFV